MPATKIKFIDLQVKVSNILGPSAAAEPEKERRGQELNREAGEEVRGTDEGKREDGQGHEPIHEEHLTHNDTKIRDTTWRENLAALC